MGKDSFESREIGKGRPHRATLFCCVKAEFAAPTDFTSYMTVSYEFGYWQANTEDLAASHVIKVGLSIPSGTVTAAEALNPLATPVLPYRGAAWGEERD